MTQTPQTVSPVSERNHFGRLLLAQIDRLSVAVDNRWPGACEDDTLLAGSINLPAGAPEARSVGLKPTTPGSEGSI